MRHKRAVLTGLLLVGILLIIGGLVKASSLASAGSQRPTARVERGGDQNPRFDLWALSPEAEFQKGMSYAAWWQGVYQTLGADRSLRNLAPTGTKWISLVVTGYQETIASTTITRSLQMTPADEDLVHAITRAHSLGMKVMLKPHVDLSNDPGHWRGEIGFNDEADWAAWFASYQAFIYHYAELAESNGVEQFCVGTELVGTSQREDDWRAVIAGVRARFSGSLTYAANHSGEEAQIQWWDAVETIGVDAYYALTDKDDPTLDELKVAWTPHVTTLANLAATWGKPIVFTEIGYRSVDGTNRHPWERWTEGTIDLQEQAACYQAVFETFWNQPWFSGLYWWYWGTDPEQGGENDGDYTPKDKPAEEVLRTYYLSEPGDWTRAARIVTPYDYPDEEWTGWEDAVDRTVADGANVILDWAAFSDTYPGRVLDPAPGLADLQQRVEYVHTHHPGVRVIVYIAPLEMQTPDADTNMDGQPDPGVHTTWTDHPEWLQMGIDGRRAVFYGSLPGMPFWVDPTDEDVWLCPNNAEYRNHITSLAADIAATGVDGVWFDVPFFVHNFGEGWQAQWPCHCPACRAKFQAETGYALPAPPSTPDWDDPAWRAFVAWRYRQTNAFIADLDAALKAVNPNVQLIIETSVGPAVTATQHGNIPLDLPGVSDLTAHEYGGPYTATKYYGWLAMLADLAFWQHTDGGQPAWLLSYVLADQSHTLDVARLHAASVLAAGFNYYTSGDYGMASTPDPAFRQQLFGWLADHDDAYYDADLQPYANVALLFSRQTLDYLDRGSWESDHAYHDEWQGMAMMLLESHVPYRVITEADLTAETLAEYDALVLPLFAAMSTAQAQTIRSYVAAGGTIVATGKTSLFDAQGQPLPDFQLADVFGVSYSQAEEETVYINNYGDGRSVFTPDRYPSEYFWAAAPTWDGGNPAQAEAIRQAFSSQVWTPAAVTPVLTTDAPRGVILLPFADDDQLVVRAVNLVGVNTDDAVPTLQDNLSLTLTLPPNRAATAGEFLDFLGEAQPLPFTLPDESHVQTTFDLGVSTVLSFTTTTTWPCQIPGDLDCDCEVDILDIMLVAACWRSTDPECDPYDLDDDGDIDIVDIMLVAVHWGESCRVDKWSLWTEGTQLRGANIWQRRVYPELDGTEFLGPGPVGPPFTQSDFDDLAALGANYVNISHPGLFTETPPHVLDQDIQDNLDSLLSMIEQAASLTEAGMFAVISARTGPGRSDFTFYWDGAGDWFDESYLNDSVWQDQAAQDAWVAMWAYTAQRYKDNPIVVGYDLMVEPNSNEVGSHALYDALDIWNPEEFYATYGGTLYDWNQLYPDITAAIRQVDSDTPILIGGNGYSSLDWLPYVEPTGDPRTVYTVHQYEPHKYTHQDAGVQDCTYPGVCDVDWDDQPEPFDQTWLEGRLSIIDTYTSTHDVPVAVNEFGAVRWTPNVDDFMDDEMTLFEQRGLNHALWVWDPAWEPWTTEEDAFNFRHGPDPDNHTDVESSDLMEVIVEHWGQNTMGP